MAKREFPHLLALCQHHAHRPMGRGVRTCETTRKLPAGSTTSVRPEHDLSTNQSKLRFGTSSWSSKGWVGPFYPDGMAAKDFLGHYAEEFNVVEADVTYYRIPDEKLVRGWDERTPDGFVICAKFPRSIVHCGEECGSSSGRSRPASP